MTTTSETMEAGISPVLPMATIAAVNASEILSAVPSYWGSATSIILEVTMSLFILVAVVGNILVLVVITKHKGMRTRTNTFLFMLAVVDLLTALLAMPVSLATVFSGRWIFGERFCQFNGFLVPVMFVTSIHLLMYIGVHKYLTITRPFDAPLTKVHLSLMIIAAWVWGAVIGFLNVYGLNRVHYKAYTTQCGPEYPHDMKTYLHTSIMILTCYVIPMAVLVFTYSRIFVEIRAYSTRLHKHSDEEKKRIFGQQKRITVTLVLVLICFVLCWTPYVVYIIYISAKKDKSNVHRNANAVVYWFGYMNSACNPIIYALHSPTFREGFRGVMCFSPVQLDSDGIDSRGLMSRLRSFVNDNLVIRSSPRSSPFMSASNLHCAQSGTQAKLTNQLKASSLPNVFKIDKNPRFITLPGRHLEIMKYPNQQSNHRELVLGANNNSNVTGIRGSFHYDVERNVNQNEAMELSPVTNDSPYRYLKKITELSHHENAASINESEIIIERAFSLEGDRYNEQIPHISTEGLVENADSRFSKTAQGSGSKRRSVIKSTDSCYVTFNLCRSSVDSMSYEKEATVASSLDDVFSSNHCDVTSLTSGKILKSKSEKNVRNVSNSSDGVLRSVKSENLELDSNVSGSITNLSKSDQGSRIWKSKKRKRKMKASQRQNLNEESCEGLDELLDDGKYSSSTKIWMSRRDKGHMKSAKSELLDPHMNSDTSDAVLRSSKSEAGLISPKHVFQRLFSWNPGKSKRNDASNVSHSSHNSEEQSKSLNYLNNRSKSQDDATNKSDMGNPLRSYPSIEKLHTKSKSRYKISSISVRYRKAKPRDPEVGLTPEAVAPEAPLLPGEKGKRSSEQRVSFYLGQKGKRRTHLRRSRSDPCIWTSTQY